MLYSFPVSPSIVFGGTVLGDFIWHGFFHAGLG